MAAEFELEHWQSRAKIAEKELDSARSVLARLRGYCRVVEKGEKDPRIAYGAVRECLRKHDQEYWNVTHVISTLAEGLGDLLSEENDA